MSAIVDGSTLGTQFGVREEVRDDAIPIDGGVFTENKNGDDDLRVK